MAKKKNTSNANMNAVLPVLIVGLSVFGVVSGITSKTPDFFKTVAFANDGEDSGDSEDSQDSDQNKNESDSNSTEAAKKASEQQREAAKKQAEATKKIRERSNEAVKKASEQQRESDKKQLEQSRRGGLETTTARTVESENEDETMDDNESEDEDVTGNESDLKNAQEKIADAERKILEQRAKGMDVTAALATLQRAKDRLATVGGATAGVTPSEVSTKSLLREVQRLADSAKEDDVKDAEDAGETIADAAKRIARVEAKLAALQSFGGDTSAFEGRLAELKANMERARQLIASGSLAEGNALAEATERQAKILKSAVESALLAFGGEDDDLFDDHGKEVSEAVHELQRAGDFQGGKLGATIRTIAQRQGVKATEVEGLAQDVRSQGGVSKFFFGPKYDTLDSLKEKIAENTQDIASLNAAAARVTDPSLKTQVLDQVQVLTQENIRIQSLVDGAEKQNGLFAWVFRLFR